MLRNLSIRLITIGLITALFIGVGTLGFASLAGAQQTIKIAYIDPLSGAFANVGDAGLKQFQFVIEEINQRRPARKRASTCSRK
jgi:hypothetical protein